MVSVARVGLRSPGYDPDEVRQDAEGELFFGGRAHEHPHPEAMDRHCNEKSPGPKELIILEGSAHAQFLFASDQGERRNARDPAVPF